MTAKLQLFVNKLDSFLESISGFVNKDNISYVVSGNTVDITIENLSPYYLYRIGYLSMIHNGMWIGDIY